MRSPGFVAVVFVFAGLVSNAQDGKQPNYYPLQVGNSWTYRVTANNKNSNIVTRISKTETINDQLLAKLDSPNIAMTEHLFQNDKGVFRARHNNQTVTPPFMLIQYPAKVGAKWKGEFKVEKEEGAYPYRGTIEAEEMVEVPAGKFATIRVAVELEAKGQKVRTVYWFAKDTGFVKQTFAAEGISLVLELEKFDRKK